MRKSNIYNTLSFRVNPDFSSEKSLANTNIKIVKHIHNPGDWGWFCCDYARQKKESPDKESRKENLD